MEVVEVVVGRSVTFHQGTCLSCLSESRPSGVVLIHHAEGVNCLCVSSLMCYVLILMRANLLSLHKRTTTVSHRRRRPMGGRRCPAAASEPMVRGPPVCDWWTACWTKKNFPVQRAVHPHKWLRWVGRMMMISVIATKLGDPTDLGDLGRPVCFQIVFLIFLHMSADGPHTLLCTLWSEGGSRSTQ